MSHGITDSDSGFLYREGAWHGMPQYHIGQDEIGPERILEVAGMDWGVYLAPSGFMDTDGVYRTVPNRYATVRDDTHEGLGVVGHKYTPIPNYEGPRLLMDLFKSGEIVMETAGSLERGALCFVLARMPEGIYVGNLKSEEVQTYIFQYWSHDGSTPWGLKDTDVRVVCRNTWTAALKGKGEQINIAHLRSADRKIGEARIILQKSLDHQRDLKEQLDRMASKTVTADQAEAFLRSMIHVPDSIEGKHEGGFWRRQALERQDELLTIYRHGPDMEQIRGTEYGLFQTVTAYATHAGDSRKTAVSSAEENRFKNLVGLSTSTSLQARALQRLTNPDLRQQWVQI